MFRKIAWGAMLAIFSITVSAAPQWCPGTMSNLWVYSDGTVFVLPSYRGDYTRICNMNAETGGVSVITCVAWFALLKNAVQRQSTIMVYYNDAPVCSALPVYGSTPIPGYVMEIN